MEHEEIKKIIAELLTRMGVGFEALERSDAPASKHPGFVIRTPDSALLIGAKGENLSAFNYLARRIAAKKLAAETPIKFFVDVNGYQEQVIEGLKNKAKIMSERARSFKADVELEPMSSFERMLVHSYLEGAPDIKTESTGDGASRRVVIKYVNINN